MANCEETPRNVMVPSKVKRKPWLFSDATRKPGVEGFRGKWMLQVNNDSKDEQGLTAHDRAWLKIKKLCDDGLLLSAQASTAGKEIRSHDFSLGLIHCHTADYRDTEDVRLKAETIRSALSEELEDTIFYYKADGEVLNMAHRVVKSQAISIYRHLPDNTLFKRAGRKQWDPL